MHQYRPDRRCAEIEDRLSDIEDIDELLDQCQFCFIANHQDAIRSFFGSRYTGLPLQTGRLGGRTGTGIGIGMAGAAGLTPGEVVTAVATTIPQAPARACELLQPESSYRVRELPDPALRRLSGGLSFHELLDAIHSICMARDQQQIRVLQRRCGDAEFHVLQQRFNAEISTYRTLKARVTTVSPT